MINLSKSDSENLREKIVRGRIRMSPILLSWFLFLREDSNNVFPMVYGFILTLLTFIFLSYFMERAKTAEKLKGLLSNHYIYFVATELSL